MPIRHVGFDLDGTLLDTRDQIVESILACIDPAQRRTARLIVVESASTSPRTILRQFGISSLDRYWHHHAELAHLAQLFFSDTSTTLGRLRDMGTTLSVVTSLPARPAKTLLKRANIADHFCLIDTFASRPYRKPSPNLLRVHLKDLGIHPAEAAYLGDSEGDMRMAKAAGLRPLGAGWGSSTTDMLARAGADCILYSLEELVEAIQLIQT